MEKVGSEKKLEKDKIYTVIELKNAKGYVYCKRMK